MHNYSIPLRLTGALLTVSVVLSGALTAQSVYVVPRTPWGDPDLQGIWPGTGMMGVPLERPATLGNKAQLTDEELAARAAQARRQTAQDEEEFVAPRPTAEAVLTGAGTGPPGHWGERGTPQRQTSIVVDPPNGRIPAMTPEGQQRTAAIPASRYYDNSGGGVFNGPEDLSVYDRCITRGLIGSMVAVGYNAGNQIVQGPDWVALRNEMIHEARMIPTDGRKHVSPRFAVTWVIPWDAGTARRSSSTRRTSTEKPASVRTDAPSTTATPSTSSSASRASTQTRFSTRRLLTTRKRGRVRLLLRFHSSATWATGCSSTRATRGTTGCATSSARRERLIESNADL